MEKDFILCPQCGQRLAQLLRENGQYPRLKRLGQARVRTVTNALGERLGWIRCPKCKVEKEINPAHWLGDL